MLPKQRQIGRRFVVDAHVVVEASAAALSLTGQCPETSAAWR